MMYLFFISFCVASVSFTISVTSIFGWLRELVSSIHPKLEELIHCPYCLGHYVAIFFILIADVSFTSLNPFIDFMLSLFSIMGIVACMHYVMLRAYDPVRKMMMMRELEKKEKLK